MSSLGTQDPSAPPRMNNIQKHEHIHRALIDIIESSEDGAMLPPERRLAEDLGVARMTVRKVVNLLQDEGLVRRIPGKGAFIARRTPVRSATEPMQSTARSFSLSSCEVHEMREIDAGARIGQRLQVAPAARVLMVSRVCLVNGERVAVERVHLPAELAKNAHAEHFTAPSLNDILHARFGVLVTQSTQVLHATSIDEDEARMLRVSAHVPAFLSEVTALDMDDRVAFHLEGIYRGDRCGFVNTSLGQADLTNPRSVVNAHFVIN